MKTPLWQIALLLLIAGTLTRMVIVPLFVTSEVLGGTLFLLADLATVVGTVLLIVWAIRKLIKK